MSKPEDEFDSSDLDNTPVERPVLADRELDHQALVEQGKRITALEERLAAAEAHNALLMEHVDRLTLAIKALAK